MIGEVELAAPFLKGRTIGITGSNGKTTTTSLIGHILHEAGMVAQVGGNIGTPVTAMVETSRADGWNVLELSSFQLETIAEFRAHIGLALNVTQNHLDRHHTFEAYAAAKGRLFETHDRTAISRCSTPAIRCAWGTPQRTAAASGLVQRPAQGGFGREPCGDKLVLDGQLLMDRRRNSHSRASQCRKCAGGGRRRRPGRRDATQPSPPRCARFTPWSTAWSSCAR